MRYDEDTIARIKEASDIVDVIGRHLELRKSGSAYKALCPFHQEKTPSFVVNPARQIFHCFGCDTGGDVLRFMMLYEGLPFVDALKKLAVQAGVDLPEGPSRGGADRDQRDRMLTANRVAAEYYSGLLMKSEAGKKARDYLGKRGIHSDVSKVFGLGYAPEGWRNLSSAGRGYSRSRGRCCRPAGKGGCWQGSLRSIQGQDRFPYKRPDRESAGVRRKGLGR